MADELFKSDMGSFEYRTSENKCGIIVRPLSSRHYQLFVNDEGMFMSKQELQMVHTEIGEILKKPLTNEQDPDINREVNVVDVQK